MSYLDRYRKRVSQHGTTEYEQSVREEIHWLEQGFENIIGYVKGTLNKEKPFDLVVQSTTDHLTKTALIRPSDVPTIKTGDYLSFTDETWIVRSINKNRLSPVAELFLCNQTLNFPHCREGIPCYVNSTSFGTKGVVNTDKFQELDSKTRIYIQRNEVTNTLFLGCRLMLSHRHIFEITEMDDMVFPGMYIIACKMGHSCEMDDFENNIAYNEELNQGNSQPPVEVEKPTLQINGEMMVKRKSTHLYTLTYPVSGHWTLDQPSLADLTVVNDSQVELCFKTTPEWLTLTFTDLNQVSVSINILIS